MHLQNSVASTLQAINLNLLWMTKLKEKGNMIENKNKNKNHVMGIPGANI